MAASFPMDVPTTLLVKGIIATARIIKGTDLNTLIMALNIP